MTAALAIPAAKLALNAAGGIFSGLSDALDPARAKAKKQADEFETVFLEQVTQRLFATTEASEGPLGENGPGGGFALSQLTQQYARQLQKAGGLGLSDQILRNLLQVQEQARSAQEATQGTANVNR